MTGADDPVGFVEPGVGSAATTHATEAASRTTQHAGHAVAIHELAERLTATTNYVAAVLRLSEVAGDRAKEIEALEKALGQLQRAGDVVVTLRKQLSEQER